mgnify:FL=1
MRRNCLAISLAIAGFALCPPASAQLFGQKDSKPDQRTRSQESVSQANALANEQKFVEALKLYDEAIRVDSRN